MSAAVVVRCDSNPAPYSAGQPHRMPCSAWLVTRALTPELARVESTHAGWSYLLTFDSARQQLVEVDTCPACVRAQAHLDARAPA